MSVRLSLFRYVFLWGGLGIVMYWIYEFRGFWEFLLWVPVSLAVFGFYFLNLKSIAQTIPQTRKLFGIGGIKKTRSQGIISAIAVLVISFISLVGGVWIAFGTNVFLMESSRFTLSFIIFILSIFLHKKSPVFKDLACWRIALSD